MPELSVMHIIFLVVAAVIGTVAGWVLRGRRAEQEKAAVSAGWQEQLDALRREHGRLLDQNKSLMEQVSQFQGQHTEAKNRAKELSLAIQEAYQRRDELQREIKDVRSSLETVLSERNQLASSMESHDAMSDLLRQKDERIEKLHHELENWQNRLPPLIERFRARDGEAERLAADLEEARARIRELEASQHDEQQTRIERVHDPDELTDGLDASNDPDEDTGGDTSPAAQSVADDDDDAGATGEHLTPQQDDHAEDEVATSIAAAGGEDETAGADLRGSLGDDQTDLIDDADDKAIATAARDVVIEPLDGKDDLKLIKGVGPAIEKTLNEMGIVTFRQIADMSEYDIDRVARRLKGFHSRIYREDWIGQARALLDEAAHA